MYRCISDMYEGAYVRAQKMRNLDFLKADCSGSAQKHSTGMTHKQSLMRQRTAPSPRRWRNLDFCHKPGTNGGRMAQTLRGVVVELASVYTFTYFKSNFWLSSPTKPLFGQSFPENTTWLLHQRKLWTPDKSLVRFSECSPTGLTSIEGVPVDSCDGGAVCSVRE